LIKVYDGIPLFAKRKFTLSHLSPLEACSMIEDTKKPELLIRQYPRCPGDRQAAEGALERNLLACRFMRFYCITPSFPKTRTFDHTLRITAILKLLKLPACPFPVITTHSLDDEG
jgi:hypothetical protein